MKKALLLIVLLSTAGAAGFFYIRNAQTEYIETYKGNVDIRTVNTSFRVSGRLLTLNADEGTHVKKGELLGTLDPEPTLLLLEQMNAQLAAQRARVALMEKGTRTEELIQANERYNAALAQFNNAKNNLHRQQMLEHSGASKETLLDEAISVFDSSKAQLEVAKQNVIIAANPYRDEELEQARAQLKAVEAEVANIKLQLEDTRLIAPADGIILTRSIEPGTLVSAGMPVLTISLIDPVWIRAYVNEPHLGRIVPGNKVQIHTDSRAAPYSGTIGFVSANAEFTPKQVETTELRSTLVYRFRVIVDNPDDALRQGMPVTIMPVHKTP